MNNYELIYIIDAALEEAARKDLIEKFNGVITANGGEVVKVEEWGKRRLAYAIDYKTEGYYVYVAFNASAELPKELSRNLGNNESVIRSQIVKLLTKKSVRFALRPSSRLPLRQPQRKRPQQKLPRRPPKKRPPQRKRLPPRSNHRTFRRVMTMIRMSER